MGKKGRGGGGGSGNFERQCEGLQGVWAESDRRQKRWVVTGAKATRQTKVTPRSYTLTEGESGELIWGINGQYVLDPAFKPGMSLAHWRKGTAQGEVAFSWDYVGPVPEDERDEWAETWMPKTAAKPKAKAKAKTNSSNWGSGNWGSGHWGSGNWDDANWDDGFKAQSQEKRTDSQDGVAYTWEELKAFYAGPQGVYTLNATKDYWDTLAPATPAKLQPPEKRTDFSDGKAYTWEELRAFYSSKYTKKEMETYWANLPTAKQTAGGEPKAKAKAKEKAKAKAKTKAKAKAYVQGLQ